MATEIKLESIVQPPAAPALSLSDVPDVPLAITVTLIIEGTSEDFDADTFKINLAAQLPGVSSDDILLSVVPASVRVTATILSSNIEARNDAFVTLTSLVGSATALSSALGVTVERVEEVPRLTREAPNVTNTNSTVSKQVASGQDASISITIIAIMAAIGGSAILILVVYVLYRRTQQKKIDRKAISVTFDVESATTNDGALTKAPDKNGGAKAGSECTGSETAVGSSSASSASTVRVRKQRAFEEMADMEWTAADITWGKKLGSGSFGTVYQVWHGEDHLAAKRFDISKDETDGSDRAEIEGVLVREFRALRKVFHENIVMILAVILDHPDWLCLIMESADRGSLRQLLNREPDQIVGKLVTQLALAHDIASALAHCHGLKPMPLLHHDIKSANVLLFSQDNTGASRLTAKVADFGLAVGVSGTSTLAGTNRTKTNAEGGTLAYRAPETFNGKYTMASEVFSFALVLWELLTGQRPWHRDAEG